MGAEAPEPDTAAPRLATVIGKNAHRLRRNARLTLDQVSIAARMRGLNWSESRVADFESGRVAPNLGTLVAFCLAMADVGCSAVTLPALLSSPSRPIEINGSVSLSDEQVVNLLSGGTAEGRNPHRQAQGGVSTPARKLPISELLTRTLESVKTMSVMQSILTASGATEERTQKALGISPMDLAELSASLWGRSFSQERDRRAGEGANAQKRGQVSRQMRAEIQAAMEVATRGDGR